MNGDYTDSINSDSIFSEPLKTLPNLENELRQLSTFSHYYENSVSSTKRHTYNFFLFYLM